MICPDCKKDMSDSKTVSCNYPFIKIDGEIFDRIIKETTNERCHDCNVLIVKGNVHHYGCDVERCPKCEFMQMIACDCVKELLEDK